MIFVLVLAEIVDKNINNELCNLYKVKRFTTECIDTI